MSAGKTAPKFSQSGAYRMAGLALIWAVGVQGRWPDPGSGARLLGPIPQVQEVHPALLHVLWQPCPGADVCLYYTATG